MTSSCKSLENSLSLAKSFVTILGLKRSSFSLVLLPGVKSKPDPFFMAGQLVMGLQWIDWPPMCVIFWSSLYSFDDSDGNKDSDCDADDNVVSEVIVPWLSSWSFSGVILKVANNRLFTWLPSTSSRSSPMCKPLHWLVIHRHRDCSPEFSSGHDNGDIPVMGQLGRLFGNDQWI